MGKADHLELGDWNATCSLCGRKRKASTMEKNWQGYWRCPEHNEARQPQDFVKGQVDVQTVPWSQPPNEVDLLMCSFDGQSAIPGLAIPGCMIPGRVFTVEGPVNRPPRPIFRLLPVITTLPTIPPGRRNVVYSFVMNAIGGTLPYVWHLQSGVLPVGLVLSSGGVIGGIPLSEGKYTITITVTDAVGGVATGSFTISTAATFALPGPPVLPVAVAGDGQAVVGFAAPVSNGGTPITGYTVYGSGGSITIGTTSPITVPGLVNNTPITFTVTATNSVGEGPASVATSAVTPVTAPGVPAAPLAPSATMAGTTATISFGIPPSGGSPIIGYTVTASPGGATQTGLISPILVTGLLPATNYTFTVTARNAIGASVASVPTNSVIVTTVPGAPTIGAALAGDQQLTISFTPPVSDGGSAITGYVATLNPGGITKSGAGSPLTFTGLVNGIPCTVTVQAVNGVGNSLPSSSVTATPVGALAITTISLPLGSSGVPYSFALSAVGGIAPYTWSLLSGTLTSLALSAGGVITGTPPIQTDSLNFQVMDSLGATAQHALTLIIAATAPSAPTSVTATVASATSALVSYVAPTNNGGFPITGYTVTSSPGGLTATGNTLNQTVTGLTTGTPYTFTVKATSSLGTGPASLPSNSVTPVSVVGLPLAPADLYLAYQGELAWNNASGFPTPPNPDSNTLVWPAVAGAVTYVIERSSNKLTWATLASGLTVRKHVDNTATLSVNGIIGPNGAGVCWPANTYWYRVAAVNANGQGPYSPTQSAYVYLGTADSSGPGGVPAYLQWPGNFNSAITVTPNDTSSGPVGSQFALLLQQLGGSFWLPYASGNNCQWNLWGGAFGFLKFDLKPIAGGTGFIMQFHRVSTQGGGDTTQGPTNLDIAPYRVGGGPIVNGAWQSFSIPYAAMLLPDPSGVLQPSLYKFTLQANGGSAATWAMNRIRYSP